MDAESADDEKEERPEWGGGSNGGVGGRGERWVVGRKRARVREGGGGAGMWGHRGRRKESRELGPEGGEGPPPGFPSTLIHKHGAASQADTDRRAFITVTKKDITHTHPALRLRPTTPTLYTPPPCAAP